MLSCFSRAPPVPICSSGHRGGRGPAPSAPRGNFSVPKRLVGIPTQENATVYTVRLSTAVRRGSALTDLNAGILVCLIGEDGSSVLRRVAPLVDPQAEADEVMRICTGEDGAPPGANCSFALDAAARRASSLTSQPLLRRFQEGSIDEISFLGTEIGPLSAVVVAPECGTWRCDELDVSSSRSGDTSRFVCRDDVGDRGTHAAAYLRPVPPGGVVYGSGDSSVVLSKEQAAQLREWNLQQYGEMKSTLLGTTAGLVALGTAGTYIVSGADLALPFAFGGVSSLAYQYLLQRRVDGVSSGGSGSSVARLPQEPKASEVQPGPGLAFNLALSSPNLRASLLSGGLVGSLLVLHLFSSVDGGGSTASDVSTAATTGSALLAPVTAAEVRRAAAGLAGFLMQKIAVIAVSVMPDKTPEEGTVRGIQQRRPQDRVE
ncbi:hypothetical protein Ndes2526B_g08207 [Nannochloris sp. 'desiccata']|nr:hypothetical protein KSW81_001686 [Chlorella desiccata (nom. nud.)]KAH7616111.1 hypothetical protein NADE_000944 [Chlorella desiccata (nom. nud.)]